MARRTSTNARRGNRGESRRRRTAFSRAMAGNLVILICVALVAAGLWVYGVSVVDAPGPLQSGKTINIGRGQRTASIARMLEQQGIISDQRIFLITALLTRSQGHIKAGEYAIRARSSMREILEQFRAGKVIVYKISVPEGFTVAQVIERVNGHDALTGSLDGITIAEGSLLPDTYLFSRGAKRVQVIEHMRQAQKKLLSQLWPKRAPGLPFTTPEQAITLASIVEKETGLASERGRIAGVFINRLKKNMRLQSDPTIIYGITKGKEKLDRPLTRADIDTPTPWNTYQIDGLPPTPIANPGREAIAAVLNPMETDELYFVADGTGGHVFATTLAEHNANVAKWRKIETASSDPASSAPAPDGDAATPAAVDVGPDPKPGSIVKVDGELVPIPKPRP